MAGLLRLAHQVQHAAIGGKVEIEIGLHAAVMHMGRHGVPDGTIFQRGIAQHELAAFHHERMDELVDGALVGGLDCAGLDLLAFADRDQP
ncbi:hypothetical protein D3C87_1814260 [compost metagenome]